MIKRRELIYSSYIVQENKTMSYNLKKDHLTNWNMPTESIEKPFIDDDHDSYISERSSTTSSIQDTPSPSLTNKQILPSPVYVPPKQPHTLRYYYNELPENGIPVASQYNLARKEEIAIELMECLVQNGGKLHDGLDEQLKKYFTETEYVELILTGSFYCMVPRVLEALQIPIEK